MFWDGIMQMGECFVCHNYVRCYECLAHAVQCFRVWYCNVGILCGTDEVFMQVLSIGLR